MAVLDDIADDLAIKALDLEAKTGDEDAIKKLAAALGNSSPTMEETFLTAVRIRRAQRRAQELLDLMISEAEKPSEDPEDGATDPDTNA